MEWFGDHLIETFFIIGVVLLVIEILVLGLSTLVLLLGGLAALATSAMMWTGLLPETFMHAMSTVGVLTLTLSIILWRPFLRLQQKVDVTPAQNDIVGHGFTLEHDIISTSAMDLKPTYLFSGVSWRLDAGQDIKKGRFVVVEQTEVGLLRVKEKDV